jgi:hypothetical protein
MTINRLTQCYELYRAQIQHEDMLLNQRGDLGVLPYKLSDWAPVGGRPMEEADEVTSSASNS